MEEIKKGAFVESLTRNNKQIKADRATAIGEDTQIAYKRNVEDLEIKIKRLKRQQENMLDLSPENSMSLKLAENFDSDEYVLKDTALALDIRNNEIMLDLAKRRYEYLFGTL